MRILICCRAIDNIAGGVERMATSLMNEMTARGHEMHFLTWDAATATSFYPLNKNVKWQKMAIGNAARRATFLEIIQRAIKTRAYLRRLRPDLIVAFQDGPYMSMRLYTLGLTYPISLAERNAPSLHDFVKIGKYRRFFYRIYATARRMTVQCASYVPQYPPYLQKKIRVIPNPVFPPAPNYKKAEPQTQKNLLAVGRLSFQKNFSCLINAFSALASEFPDWSLLIAGEGEERAMLESLIQSRNLTGRVTLFGATTQTADLFAKADLFCHPAKWEGFPNALAEALAHGVPAIGFENCAGVRDLIVHGENGLLAGGNGDVNNLIHALRRVMDDDTLRQKLANQAAPSVAPYAPAAIYDLWESLFAECVRR